MLFDQPIVQMLWHGGPLSNLERLCMISHLRVGHIVHLYCYDPVDAPQGVILKDAKRIWPEKDIFAYAEGEGKGSYSAFSNCFRYKLLYRNGNWWSDTDVVCLRRFDFGSKYVFASERQRDGESTPTTCIIRTPPESEIMKYCLEQSQWHNRKTVLWGTIGPRLLTQAIIALRLDRYVQSPDVFCPYDWFLSEVDPEGQLLAPAEVSRCHGVHLWHEMWRRAGLDKNATYHENSLFERLKRAIL